LDPVDVVLDLDLTLAGPVVEQRRLSLDAIELYLMNRSIIKIGEQVACATRLEHIFVGSNQIGALPEAFFTLPRLRELMAQKNLIVTLSPVRGPADITDVSAGAFVWFRLGFAV
jgi:Leucine-rich repeat (LRR) protein